MNINDARSQRRDLERQIVDMIIEYERETGMNIASIFLKRTLVRESIDSSAVIELDVKVDVEL
mgnify:CR=1 FL=1